MKGIKKNRIINLISIGTLILVMNSCLGIFCVDGNGVSVTEERILDSYSGISNETAVNVSYEKGDAYSLFIEADENLLQYIHTLRHDKLSVQ